MTGPGGPRTALSGVCTAAVLALAGTVRAQAPGAALTGRVVAESGAGVPFALVGLDPAQSRRFTDDQGRFAFLAVSPGRYRFSARQVGYRPLDTLITLGEAGAAITVALRPVIVQLPPMSVHAALRCTRPGVPDSATAPDLAAAVAQLRANAERFVFLSDSFPFRYDFERTFIDADASGREIAVRTDTVHTSSREREAYRPGAVVRWGRGPGGERARVIQLPTLEHFADSSFFAAHCFRLTAAPADSTGNLLRIEFLPAESIQFSDLRGEVLLESGTLQIRSVTIELTHPTRSQPSVSAVTVTMRFVELFPNIVLPRTISGDVRIRFSGGAGSFAARSRETQRLIRVEFERELPGRQQ